MLVDPSELLSPRPVEPPSERAGFLVAPDLDDPVNEGDTSESGPWLLIDPEELGRSEIASPAAPLPFPGSDEPDPAAADEHDSQRLADLEYLFAARTVDVGPMDLSLAEADQPHPHAEPDLEGNTSEAPNAEPLAPQMPEAGGTGTGAGTGPPSYGSAIAIPVEPASGDEFDSDESLDELLAEFSAATAPPSLPDIDLTDRTDVTVPSAEVVDHAAAFDLQPLPEIDLTDRTDVTVPSAEVVDHAAGFDYEPVADFDSDLHSDPDSDLDFAPGSDFEFDPEFDDDPALGYQPDLETEFDSALDYETDWDPGAGSDQDRDRQPAAGLFFDTPGRHESEQDAPQLRAKSPAEVFASETSLLPARTRRGDQVLVEEQHDADHSWFNKSGELPLLNLDESGAVRKSRRRARRFFKRLLTLVVILAVAAGCLYVALNSIYL